MDSSSPRSAALIVNAHSRKGRAQFRHAARALRHAGVTIASAHALRDPATLPGLMRAAVASGVRMVIVGGGDGTISGAVDHLAGTDIVFGVLPLGTANSFARTLGLPLDLAGAVAVIAAGATRRVDLGMLDGDYFANCATIGIAPQIAETVPDGLKAWLGRPGYLLWALRQLAAYRPFRVTIGEETLDAVEVRIANGRYHGGVDLIEGARLDSGTIIVQAVIGHSRLALLLSWLAALLRLPVRRRLTREFEGEAIHIATDPPMPISIDGEVLAKTPVIARVAPGALLIAAPAPGMAVPHGGIGLHWRLRGAGSGQLRRLGAGVAVAGLATFLWRRRRR